MSGRTTSRLSVVFILVTIVTGCILFQVHYTSENVAEGKSAAKKVLQQSLGLQQTDTPIVGIITRLTVQKGIHLIKHAIYRTLERNGQVKSLAHGYFLQVCNVSFTMHSAFLGLISMLSLPCCLKQLELNVVF